MLHAGCLWLKHCFEIVYEVLDLPGRHRVVRELEVQSRMVVLGHVPRNCCSDAVGKRFACYNFHSGSCLVAHDGGYFRVG